MIAAFAVTSCLYPFDPEAQGEGGRLVIEGDILIGEQTIVRLSYTAPLGGVPKSAPEAYVLIKDENGKDYAGKYVETKDNTAFYSVDMTDASPDLKYSLHVNSFTDSKSYETELLEVHKGAVIDSLAYILDVERSLFNVGISVHTTGESFFRWTYVEDWQFHSFYNSYLIYENPVYGTSSWNGGRGKMRYRNYDEDIYTCWGHEESTEIIIFSTENQSEDRFVDLEFRSFPNTEMKISGLYHIEVNLEAMSKDAYEYWNNIKTNSEYSGDLFTPNPSEMVGNIRCVQDPDEMVIGFINAAQRSTRDVYYDNTFIAFFDRTYPGADTSKELNQSDWKKAGSDGWIPLYFPNPMDESVAIWGRADCVDCRRMGGTKEKPDYWPLFN